MATQPARTHEGLFTLIEFKFSKFICILEIEEQIREIQAKKSQHINSENGDEEDERISMSLSKGNMDSEIYGDNNKWANYNTSIAANDDNDYEVII